MDYNSWVDRSDHINHLTRKMAKKFLTFKIVIIICWQRQDHLRAIYKFLHSLMQLLPMYSTQPQLLVFLWLRKDYVIREWSRTKVWEYLTTHVKKHSSVTLEFQTISICKFCFPKIFSDVFFVYNSHNRYLFLPKLIDKWIIYPWITDTDFRRKEISIIICSKNLYIQGINCQIKYLLGPKEAEIVKFKLSLKLFFLWQ